MQTERIYISGPMSGYENYNYEAFHDAADQWREAGHIVENPAEHFNGRQDLGYEEYLRRDVQAVFECSHVAVLPGWENSKGARLEVHLAVALGRIIIDGRKVVKDLKRATHVPVDDHGEPARDPEETSGGTLYAQRHPESLEELIARSERTHLPYLTEFEKMFGPPEPKVHDFNGLVDGGGYKGSMDDPKKLPLWLVPNALIHSAARALQHGAKKYAPNNWRRGMSFSEVYSALQRHLTAWNEGEDIDPDSGLNHLDHAAACLAFLCEYVEQGDLYASFDTRFKRPKGSVA